MWVDAIKIMNNFIKEDELLLLLLEFNLIECDQVQLLSLKIFCAQSGIVPQCEVTI